MMSVISAQVDGDEDPTADPAQECREVGDGELSASAPRSIATAPIAQLT